MLRICSLFILLVAVTPALAGPPVGKVRVVDGDTLDVGGTRVRLFGIDAPESNQTCENKKGGQWACGKWATRGLTRMTRGQIVTCEAVAKDRYQRTVARCYLGKRDIAEDLVAGGYATAYRRYSRDYVKAETRARRRGVGIWAGPMQTPSDFRRAPKVIALTGTRGCAIKGNISSNGRIYHLPGQKFYDNTKISRAKGERWFCSEDEARKAGWRRAKR